MKYFFLIPCFVVITACSNDNLDTLIVKLRETRNVDTCDGVIDKRGDIVRKIGKTMNPRAIEPLIEALKSKDETVFRWGNVCSPSSGITYLSIIRVLSDFGPLAQDAIPRLTELLEDPGTVYLSRRDILKALEKITPENVVEIAISVLIKNADAIYRTQSRVYDRDYIRSLLSYEDKICLYKDQLSPIFFKAKAITNVHKATFFIYCSNDENDLQFTRELLMDPEVLSSLDWRSFEGSGNKFLPIVSDMLESFDALFPDSIIPRNHACGGPLTSIEANRNALRGILFAILNKICTPESMKAREFYKKMYNLDYTCGGTATDCLRKLQMGAANNPS